MINEHESLSLSRPAVVQQKKPEWEISLLQAECALKWYCLKIFPFKWYVFILPYACSQYKHGSRAGGTCVTHAEAHLDASPIPLWHSWKAHWNGLHPPSGSPIVIQTLLPLGRAGTRPLCVTILPRRFKGLRKEAGSILSRQPSMHSTLSSKDCLSTCC